MPSSSVKLPSKPCDKCRWYYHVPGMPSRCAHTQLRKQPPPYTAVILPTTEETRAGVCGPSGKLWQTKFDPRDIWNSRTTGEYPRGPLIDTNWFIRLYERFFPVQRISHMPSQTKTCADCRFYVTKDGTNKWPWNSCSHPDFQTPGDIDAVTGHVFTTRRPDAFDMRRSITLRTRLRSVNPPWSYAPLDPIDLNRCGPIGRFWQAKDDPRPPKPRNLVRRALWHCTNGVVTVKLLILGAIRWLSTVSARW